MSIRRRWIRDSRVLGATFGSTRGASGAAVSTGEERTIDPALFDLLHELRRSTRTRGPFHVISCYRLAGTNAGLRAAGRGVAERRLHVEGRAVDVRLADVSTPILRDAALELKRGGVGYYRRSDLVHVDTGRVRRW